MWNLPLLQNFVDSLSNTTKLMPFDLLNNKTKFTKQLNKSMPPNLPNNKGKLMVPNLLNNKNIVNLSSFAKPFWFAK
jgi:hypothetical protein